MNTNAFEIKEVNIDDLISFSLRSHQIFQGPRLDQLVESIKETGLQHPITIRPTNDGKYEVLSGHNRIEAYKRLGKNTIQAYVKHGYTDEMALAVFYDTNLNQQSFSDWDYSHKIEAVKYSDKHIRENSQQGKRTDIEEKRNAEDEGVTSIQIRQKSDDIPKRKTSRDKMARRLGISTATLSKYRSIIKMQEDMIQKIATMLDERIISFEVAYRISRLKSEEIELLVNTANLLDVRPDVDQIKALLAMSRASEVALSDKEIKAILLSTESKWVGIH